MFDLSPEPGKECLQSLVPTSVGKALRLSGDPLPAGTRRALESHLGSGFGDVRVHAGPEAAESARAIGALAYTTGNNVVFGAGQYAPGTDAGHRLIAHELAHVVQQRQGPLAGAQAAGRVVQRKPDGTAPAAVTPAPAHEAKAEQAAASAPAPAPASAPAPAGASAPATAKPELVLWARAQGHVRRTAAGVERTAELFDARGTAIGSQLPGGRFQLTDGGSFAAPTESHAGAPSTVMTDPASFGKGVTIPGSGDWKPNFSVGRPGSLNWATELFISNYEEQPSDPAVTGQVPFTATYEFLGDARQNIVERLKSGLVGKTHVDNKLDGQHQVYQAKVLGGFPAVELVYSGTEVSANSEGSINVPADWTHGDTTSTLRKQVEQETPYSTLNVGLFQRILDELEKSPDKGPYLDALTAGNLKAGAKHTGRSFGNWFTETVGRSPSKMAEKGHPQLAAFFRSRQLTGGKDRYNQLLIESSTDKKGVVTTTNVGVFQDVKAKAKDLIPLDVSDNFITGFSSDALSKFFPTGALGIMWIEGKEKFVQAFFVGDRKGGADGKLEVPRPLMTKVDGQALADQSMYSVAHPLKNQKLHVVVFFDTPKAQELFVDKPGEKGVHSVVSAAAARDPFGLLNKYLLTK